TALVLMVSIEAGDSQAEAKAAIDASIGFARKQKLQKMVLYPFAHLSNNLEGIEKSMVLFKSMKDYANEQSGGDIEVVAAPFGWNKQLSLDIKGHPLSEQSHSYGSAANNAGMEKGPAKVGQKRIDISIVKKSDWSGLPDTDHRTIGERLDLYSFQEVSPGMVYWHPNGLTMYNELKSLMRDKEMEYGYQEISTPAIANIALWKVSGHLDHYKDDMFMFESSFGNVGLKPMNCPSSILIFKTKKWSYRELPFRTAIFDRIYRSELSGVASGLFRVKEFTQDDGHIFAREDQIESELMLLLKMVKETYDIFGMSFTAKLSTKPDNHMGNDELWDKAEGALKKAMEHNHVEYEVKDKEGAFYGPKIDFDVKDSMGRSWQLSTLQLDYQLPINFKLEYTGEDGKRHTPVIIHRAILGTLERFLGVAIEHYGGKFPTWLAPIQAIVISISEPVNDYAKSVYEAMRKGRIRAGIDISDKTLEYKIRDARMHNIPYIIVVGAKEKEAQTLSVRNLEGKQKYNVKLEALISALKEEISARSGTYQSFESI
ncbi:threonyl-tRNA synthetase, partial [mine drainage metagenome]